MKLKHFNTIIGETQTRALLVSPLGEDEFQIASDWLADLLDAREKTDGFQYNDSFAQWLCQREGWNEDSICMDSLKTLVYNAQIYRGDRTLRAAGFSVLTDDMIAAAISENKKIVIYSSGILSNSEVLGTPKQLTDGRYIVLAGRSKTKGWNSNSLVPAKIETPAQGGAQ